MKRIKVSFTDGTTTTTEPGRATLNDGILEVTGPGTNVRFVLANVKMWEYLG